MSSPTPEEVATFKQAWHEEDSRQRALYNDSGEPGARTTAGLTAAFEARDQRQASDISPVSPNALNALARLDGDPVDVQRVQDEMTYWRNTAAAYAAAQRRATSREQAAREEANSRVAYAAAIVTGDARWDKQEELERVTAELAELRRAYQKLWSDSDGMRR